MLVEGGSTASYKMQGRQFGKRAGAVPDGKLTEKPESERCESLERIYQRGGRGKLMLRLRCSDDS